MRGFKQNNHAKAEKIIYNGCLCHSKLELKFILLIEDKCSWIREPIRIYYNPDNLKITDHLIENTKRYAPDFLVRKWKDHSAHLIEIKPKKFLYSAQMNVRRVIVDQYKKKYTTDWSFKVLTEDDIKLNDKQMEKFNMAVEASKHAFAEIHLIKRRSKFFRNHQPYLSNVPMINAQHISEEEYKRYVKWWILPTPEQEYDYL